MQRLENALYDVISTCDEEDSRAIVYFKKGTFDEKLSYKSDFRDMGCLHRVGGPAVEWDNGTKVWMVNGEYHRLDGPAIDYVSGTKCWYVRGEHLSPEKENLLNIWYEKQNKS